MKESIEKQKHAEFVEANKERFLENKKEILTEIDYYAEDGFLEGVEEFRTKF
jgi:hypothetical protein